MVGIQPNGGTMTKMTSLIYVMTTMFNVDRSNGVNGNEVSDEGTLSGIVAPGQ